MIQKTLLEKLRLKETKLRYKRGDDEPVKWGCGHKQRLKKKAKKPNFNIQPLTSWIVEPAVVSNQITSWHFFNKKPLNIATERALTKFMLIGRANIN